MAGDVPPAYGDLLERGIASTRVLLLRGIILRAISALTSLALVALVAPADLGLLAAVRGLFGLIEFGSELGLQLALIRSPSDPGREALAALVGLRTVLLVVILGVVAVLPEARTAFGLIPEDLWPWLRWPLLFLLVTPLQSACKILLERDLQFAAVSRIEIAGITLQNVCLVIAAATGHFLEGIFLTLAALQVYYTIALYRAKPVIAWSLRLTALQPLWQDVSGFTLYALLNLARDSVTPLVVAKLFGLPVAGLWSFAVRGGQLLQLTIEANYRAGLAVAARLGEIPGALREYCANVLRDTSAIVYPVAGILVLALPVVPLVLPKWTGAVHLTQIYVLGLGVLGVLQVTLTIAALARQGSQVLVREQSLFLGAFWLGLVLCGKGRPLGVAVAFVIGLMLAVVYLWGIIKPDVRPRLRNLFGAPLAVLTASVLASAAGQVLNLNPVAVAAVGAMVPGVLVIRWLSRTVRTRKRGLAVLASID